MSRSSPMHAATIAIALAGGCGSSPRPADVDAAVRDAPVDVILAACPSTPNATTVVGTQMLGFAGLGNVDVGGEPSCGGPPEGAMIVLSRDAARSELVTNLTFTLPFPITLGPRSVLAYRGAGSSVTITVYVTNVESAATAPAVRLVEGMLLDGASGSFAAPECTELTTSCI
jgi:hypothetical protein